MKPKIWERYFLLETIKVFLLITFCFYGLFILIDYASHSGAQQHHSMMSFEELFHHYLYEWILRADVLVPFALLIATIRTLCDLNVHNELVALQASGVAMSSLLRPFIFLALLFTFLIYCNTEWNLPSALAKTRRMHTEKEVIKKKKEKQLFVQHIELKDYSTLLFQDYDKSKKRFFDAYWIQNFNEIWRCQYLYPYENPPLGTQVDHLRRAPDGSLYKAETFSAYPFTQMHFNQKILLDTLTPPRELSISTLWKRIPKSLHPISEKEAEMTSAFLHKIAIPWLCFFAVLAPAPFCVKHSRMHPIFFIYAFSIFSLVGCYLILNSGLILGARQTLPPLLSIGAPFSVFFCLVLWNFPKKKRLA